MLRKRAATVTCVAAGSLVAGLAVGAIAQTSPEPQSQGGAAMADRLGCAPDDLVLLILDDLRADPTFPGGPQSPREALSAFLLEEAPYVSQEEFGQTAEQSDAHGGNSTAQYVAVKNGKEWASAAIQRFDGVESRALPTRNWYVTSFAACNRVLESKQEGES